MLVASDLNMGSQWMDVRKAQDSSRNFGEAPTAAWTAVRKVGTQAADILAFIKSTPASSFYHDGPPAPKMCK